MTKLNQTFGVVGCGKLGSAITAYLSKSGNLKWIVARTNYSFENAARSIEPKSIFRSINDIKEIPDIIILAVNDSEIKNTAKELALKFQKQLKGKLIFHCSGFLTAQNLKVLQSFEARIASLHPFQTFFYNSENVFDNVAWGIEAEHNEIKLAEEIVQFFKGKPVILSEEMIQNKAAYHAVAVAASNFTTAALSMSINLAKELKLPFSDLLPTILRQTVENNIKSIENSGKIPLTGPIARGDKDAVRCHISALSNHSDLLLIYKHFSFASAIIAHNEGNINSRDYIGILNVIKESSER